MHGTIAQPRAFYDAPRNLAVYDAPELFAQLQSTVPEARVLSARHIAMPLSVHSNQVCRWLGLPALPLLDLWKYDWPGRYKPFEAQRVTANFLAAHPRAFVLSDMGTGKTLATLWAADFVLACNPGMKALVVAPLSTLQRVWSDAVFQNFMTRRTSVIVHGSKQQRLKALEQNVDFYIINYDGVGVIADVLKMRPDIQLVIIDEASAYKVPVHLGSQTRQPRSCAQAHAALGAVQDQRLHGPAALHDTDARRRAVARATEGLSRLEAARDAAHERRQDHAGQ